MENINNTISIVVKNNYQVYINDNSRQSAYCSSIMMIRMEVLTENMARHTAFCLYPLIVRFHFNAASMAL